ncbi:histidine kinase [Streptomyces chilikensis]|uniref:histidine kinase n=1 Tax=Streptomyces chilikensis TaxID=1194079 RepID=A0ABV3ELP0_9ACTN
MPFLVPRPSGAPPATWTAYGLTTLYVLPLVWRRRAPVATLLAVLAASALFRLTVDGPGQPLPYSGLVALYTVAVSSSPRERLACGVLTTVTVFPAVALNTGEARELLFTLFVFAAAYAFGRLTHTRQAYVRAVEDRARQLQVTRRIETEQAAARERARIAREMHDVLSHAVSLMIVQAEAGPVAVRTAPERAEAAFEAISEAGRDAMTQLRHMLGVLRDDSSAGGARPSTGKAPRAPQPSLADLPRLLDSVSRSGLRVEFAATGEARPLPPAAGAAVYRIVQEALTNVVKHAGARTATVRLEYGPGDLRITVTDDGHGPGEGDGDGPGLRRGSGDGHHPGEPSGPRGHGLIGVWERASAHGGTVWTGPGPGGRGFSLRAELPLVTSPPEVGS